MDQSADAHIGACVVVQQAVKESRGDGISWSVSQMNAYFGLSWGGKYMDFGISSLLLLLRSNSDEHHSCDICRSVLVVTGY